MLPVFSGNFSLEKSVVKTVPPVSGSFTSNPSFAVNRIQFEFTETRKKYELLFSILSLIACY